MAQEAPVRVQRGCSECGQVDDHPRHTHTAPDDSGQMVDLVRHMDCCAAAGCPGGSCSEILAQAGDARGPDLIRFLTEGPPGG